jgi:hypothetical protein
LLSLFLVFTYVHERDTHHTLPPSFIHSFNPFKNPKFAILRRFWAILPQFWSATNQRQTSDNPSDKLGDMLALNDLQNEVHAASLIPATEMVHAPILIPVFSLVRATLIDTCNVFGSRHNSDTCPTIGSRCKPDTCSFAGSRFRR